MNFENLDTNKEIFVDISNDATYIYGVNGSGKTTFTRKLASEKNLESIVFNSDFVTKNIFITRSDGATTDTDVKENFTTLFLGEDSVKYANSINEVKQKIKNMRSETNSNKSKLTAEFTSNNLPTHFEINDDVLKNLDYKYEYDNTKTQEENKKNFLVTSSLKTEIDNDEQLSIQVNRYKEIIGFNSLNDQINTNEVLKKLFIDKNGNFINTLNEKAESFNDKINDIIAVEKAFQVHGDSMNLKQWIEKGLELHKNYKNCLFCKNEDIEKEIENWRLVIKSEYSIIKEDALKFFNNTLAAINILLNEKTKNINFIPKIIKSCEVLYTYLNNAIANIKANQNVGKFSENIDVDELIKSNDEIYKQIAHYIVNKNISIYIFPLIELKRLEEEDKALTAKIAEENKKNIEGIVEKIEIVANDLGLQKEVKIRTDYRGNIPKLSLEPENGMGALSEGQRHKLALVVFLAKIEMENKKYDYIVLDDPMVTLDVVTYHKFRKYFTSKLVKKSEKVIVLTHNFHFLLFMLSNALDNNEIKEKITLLNLYSDKCVMVNVDSIAKDDILFFKECINESKTVDHISLWSWMTLKLARLFMDIKTKTEGFFLNGNPAKELEKLFRNDEQKLTKAKKINNKITSIAKDKNITVGKAIENLDNLNDFLLLLGFKKLIIDSELNDLKNRCKNFEHEPLSKNPFADSFNFEILKEAHKIIFLNNADKNLINYIYHTRHQITESLICFMTRKEIDIQ